MVLTLGEGRGGKLMGGGGGHEVGRRRKIVCKLGLNFVEVNSHLTSSIITI